MSQTKQSPEYPGRFTYKLGQVARYVRGTCLTANITGNPAKLWTRDKRLAAIAEEL